MYHKLLIIILIFFSSSTLEAKKCFKKVMDQIFNLDQSVVIIGQPEVFPLINIPIYLSSINSSLIEEANQLIVQIEQQSDVNEIFKKLKPSSTILFVINNANLVLRIYNFVQMKQFFKVMILSSKGEIFSIESYYKILRKIHCGVRNFLVFPIQNYLKVAYLVDSPFVTNELDESPGIMTSLLRLTAEKANLTLDYSQNCSTFQKELIQNGTISQLIEGLIRGDFDVAIGHLMMNSTTTTPFDFGPVLYNDILHFAGPKPQKLKSYRKLLLVFEPTLWVVLVLGVFGMALVYYFFALIDNFPETHFLWTLIDVFSMSIGTSDTKPLKLMSFKILLFSYLMFFLSMDAIYLGNLSKIFATASYDIKLDNMVSLTASCKTYAYDWRSEKLLLLTYVTRDLPFARKRLKIVPFSQIDMLRITASQHRNGTILFQSVMEAYPSLFSNLDYFSPHTIYLSLYVTFYLRKFSPYRDSIQFWSQEIVERGFVVKWYRDFAWKNTDPRAGTEDEEERIVLKLAHFEESFRTLLIGYLLALVIFCWEMVYQKLERIGVAQKVEDFVWFLMMLYKPPNVPMRTNTRDK